MLETHVTEMESFKFASDSADELKLAQEIIQKVVEYKQTMIHYDLVKAKWGRQDEGDKKSEYWDDMQRSEHRVSTIINELMEMAESYQEISQ